jgi:hypothetical protein
VVLELLIDCSVKFIILGLGAFILLPELCHSCLSFAQAPFFPKRAFSLLAQYVLAIVL